MKRLVECGLLIAWLVLAGCAAEKQVAQNNDPGTEQVDTSGSDDAVDTLTPQIGDTVASDDTPDTVEGDSTQPETELMADVQPATIPQCEPGKMGLVKIAAAKQRLALCNNGEPAVFYIRWGSQKNRDKWIIHLEGGGGCTNVCDCEQRWRQGRKSMTPATNLCRGSQGFLNTSANNAFGDWTVVFVPYCSSDGHAGDLLRTRDMEKVSKCEIRGKDAPPAWQFRGHRIIRAVFEDLANPARFPQHNLTTARMVLFSGTSAGSIGMQRNLDWVAGFVKSVAQKTLETVRGIADAAWEMTPPEKMNYCAAMQACDKRRFEYTGARLDESCMKKHADKPWACLRNEFQGPELTTPFFIYMDQLDHKSMEMRNILPTKAGVFEDEEIERMRRIASNIVKSVRLDDGYRSGVYLTRLGYHTSFLGPRFFKNYLKGVSMHDVLVNWLKGSGIMSAVNETPFEETDWDFVVQQWNKFDSPQTEPQEQQVGPCACQ